MALALYRKYRPATFAEVVGQEHVTAPLVNAVDGGRINHAYLFSGPRGCGKTSSARILARSLNCEQGPTSTPCGVCVSCVALAPDGPGSIDVIEIDAASHGGVDDARDLRERAFFAPVHSRYKVYIVDEAHMVTTAGFNALLKVVEEPPEFLVFVFATTEPEKVLPTIRSRTHHYPFRLVPPATLRQLLESTCQREGVTVEPTVFPLVVRAGGGSVRDSLSILDQLLAGAGPEGVTYRTAVGLLGVTDDALLDETVDALAAHDAPGVFQAVDRVVEAGHDPRRFATDLLDRLRDLIVLQAVPEAGGNGLLDCPPDRLDLMSRQATALGQASLSRLADTVHEGLTEMRGTTAPRLLLELVCARMLLPGVDGSAAATLQRLERLERRMSIAGEHAGPASSSPAPVGAVAAAGAPSGGPAVDAPEGVDRPGAARKEYVRPSQSRPEPARPPAQAPQAQAQAPQAPAPQAQGPAPQGHAPQGPAPHAQRPAPAPEAERPAPAPQAERPAPRSEQPAPAPQVQQRSPAAATAAERAAATEPDRAPARDAEQTPATAAERASATEPERASATETGQTPAGRPGSSPAQARQPGQAPGAQAERPAPASSDPAASAAADDDGWPEIAAPGSAATRPAAPQSEPAAEVDGWPEIAVPGARTAARPAPAAAAPSAPSGPAATGAAPAGSTGRPAGGDRATGAAEPAGPPVAGDADIPLPPEPTDDEDWAPTSRPAQAPAPAAQPPAAQAPAAQAPAAQAPAAQAAPPSAAGSAPRAAAESSPAPRGGEPTPMVSANPPDQQAGDGELTTADVRRIWPELMGVVKRHKRTTEALLKNAQVHDLTAGVLTLSTTSPALSRRLGDDLNKDVIREALNELLGVRWRVATVVDGGDAAPGGGRDAPQGPPPTRQETQRAQYAAQSAEADALMAEGAAEPTDGTDAPPPVDPEQAALQLLRTQLGAHPVDS